MGSLYRRGDHIEKGIGFNQPEQQSFIQTIYRVFRAIFSYQSRGDAFGFIQMAIEIYTFKIMKLVVCH
ncbi:hypothetical protein NL42_15730 [Acinetobacter sp. GN11]